jgi:predicted  nucleic acid-binding Zn-ribbon protein
MVDLSYDELQELKGDLPQIVEELETTLQTKKALKEELEKTVNELLKKRDAADAEIVQLREAIEKYKDQQFHVKTNKQYDALAREIDYSQERILKLQKEMDSWEGKVAVAKEDFEKLSPEIETIEKQLAEKKKELAAVNKEHESEELKLKNQRDKIVAKITKTDYKMYERIRKARDGKAVVPVRRNSCAGCYNRIPPQRVLELRKNNAILTCERCGRILVSDEIVEKVKELI